MQGEHRERISRGRPRAAGRRPAEACPSASHPSPGVALVEAPVGVPTRAGVRSAERRDPDAPGSRRSSLPGRRAVFCLQDELYTVCPLPWTFRISTPVLQRSDCFSDTRVGCASASGVRRVMFVGFDEGAEKDFSASATRSPPQSVHGGDYRRVNGADTDGSERPGRGSAAGERISGRGPIALSARNLDGCSAHLGSRPLRSKPLRRLRRHKHSDQTFQVKTGRLTTSQPEQKGTTDA
jgi:hypothetical protein